MPGNFIAALQQMKYGVDRVDKGNPYLFLNAPLEVSYAIFPRPLHGFCETPEIASPGVEKEDADGGRDSIFAMGINGNLSLHELTRHREESAPT